MKTPTLLLSLLSSCLIAGSLNAATPDNRSCALDSTSRSFVQVAKHATKAVIFIKVEGAVEEPWGSMGQEATPYDPFSDEFFQKFFGTPPNSKRNQQQAPMSQGSGFIISSDGYVVTNAHVVHGAEKMTVVFHDGKELPATLVGADPNTDIAVIKVEAKDLPILAFADSETLEIGEWAIAIGSPFQLESSLTVGVISAKGRQNLRITDFEDFIQTDAAINPGNSGGPLLNLCGEVIGINTAIATRSGGYMGIGFAIPSNMAKNIIKQIIDKGVVTRGFLGITMQPVDKEIAEAFNLDKPEGALVSEVLKDSPAEKGGVQQGDIILEYNKTPIKSIGSFRNEVSLMEPGSTLKLKVNRKGQVIMLNVKLGSAASNQLSVDGNAMKLGLEVSNITPEIARQLGISPDDEGVVVTKVKPGSPTAMAGIRPGFVIIAINHKKVANVEDFNNAINDPSSKGRVLILAKQGNYTRFYSIKSE